MTVLTTTNNINTVGTSAKQIKFATAAVYNAWMDEWKSAIDIVEKTDLAQEEYMAYEGGGAAPEKTQGAPADESNAKEGYKTTIPQRLYVFEQPITWEMREWASKNSNFVKQMGGYISRSLKLRQEYGSANVAYNNAFNSSFVGGDGQQLIDTDHPWKTGGTYSNQLSAANLDKTQLEAALKVIAAAQMENSIPAALKAKGLHFSNTNVFKVPELLKSSLDPETANNTYNVFMDFRLGKNYNHYITATNDWFIDTDVDVTCMFSSQEPTLEDYYDNKTKNLVIQGFLAAGWGFLNPLGYYGSQGA